MFDVIAIDWGSEFFGVAFGSWTSKLIIPSTKVYRASNFIRYELDLEIKNRQIKYIVIGMPYNFQGKKTEVSFKVEAFMKLLQQKYPLLKVQIINERGTNKFNNQKNLLSHNLAALEILKRFFEQSE